MRLHQKSITIKLDENTSNELFDYLNANSFKSEQKLLLELIQTGLNVQNGKYHDQELANIQLQLDSLIRNADANNKTMQHIISGLADVQDSITQQTSDTELLITPYTQHSQKDEKYGQ